MAETIDIPAASEVADDRRPAPVPPPAKNLCDRACRQLVEFAKTGSGRSVRIYLPATECRTMFMDKFRADIESKQWVITELDDTFVQFECPKA